MFVLGILVLILGFALLTLIGTNFNIPMSFAMIDYPTTLSFIIVIIAVIISTNSFKTFIRAINALLSKKYNISAHDKDKAIRLFKLLGKSVNYTSVLFTVLGLMLTLLDLSDLSMLGPSISIAILTILQGAFINLAFIYPAIYVLENRYNTEVKTVISEKQVIDKLLELCYKQEISPEEILAADEIFFRKSN